MAKWLISLRKSTFWLINLLKIAGGEEVCRWVGSLPVGWKFAGVGGSLPVCGESCDFKQILVFRYITVGCILIRLDFDSTRLKCPSIEPHQTNSCLSNLLSLDTQGRENRSLASHYETWKDAARKIRKLWYCSCCCSCFGSSKQSRHFQGQA